MMIRKPVPMPSLRVSTQCALSTPMARGPGIRRDPELASSGRVAVSCCASFGAVPQTASSTRHLRNPAQPQGWATFSNGMASHLPTRSRATTCKASSSSEGSAAATSELEAAKKELKALEEERDEAVATAETCARTAMKLSEMMTVLGDLALKRVKEGDEIAARQVLQEKASTKEILDRTSTKAQNNYALAARLAAKIGDKQSAVLALLRPGGAPEVPKPSPTPPPPPPPSAAPRPSPSTTYQQKAPAEDPWSTPGPSSGSRRSDADWPSEEPSFGSSSGGSSGDSYSGGGMPKWQQSLEEAKQRMSEIEKTAGRAGRAARLTAEESIAEARDRLRLDATEDIFGARDRLGGVRRGADDSFRAAQERLRKQDDEVLGYVKGIMARYRRGEYVAEDELEFAFQQLEKRSMM